jgi:DNA topoisomerase-1
VPARKKQNGKAVAPATGSKKSPARKPAAPKKATSTTKATTTAVSRAATPKRPAVKKGTYDLVIVESPAKAKTINKYLGSNYRVLASYGHVRDLPRRRRSGEVIAGVNLKGWVPTYVVEDKDDKKGGGARPAFKRRSTKDILAEIRREANKAAHIYLATDPDREGEAIAWHLEDELKFDDERTFRVTFNEITRTAVQQALARPGKIDMHLVKAQEARRILDRVVGYPLSSLLGQKVTRGLSAGRVQSVAVRLIVEREREIEAFKPEEYWKIAAILAPQGTVRFEPKPFTIVPAKKKGAPSDGEVVDTESDGVAAPAKPQAAVPEGTFRAELAEWNGAKFAAASEEQARGIAEALDVATYRVRKIEQKDQSQRPQAPFTTSTMQQQASLRLHFSASRTMQTAQKLYEGVELGGEGQTALITYMRTDSTRISNDALQAVRGHIQSAYGDRYLPEKPNQYASGKSAQEAHEAIRPTDVAMTPQRAQQFGLQGDQLKLYTLIYNRFVASQMTPAVFAVTNVEVEAENRERNATGTLKAQGRILKFDGFRRVLPPGGKQEDALLPNLTENQPLDTLELTASQHFTEPPPRFNEASLVKALEKEGIGRPSTYASIISTIQNRGYVEQKDRRFYATEIGMTVTDLLIKHFPNVMDVKFTSHFEEELDDIADRKAKYREVLDEFWKPFSKALEHAKTNMGVLRGQETGEKCPKCGKPLVVQFSRKTGASFVGCSGWKDDPPCKYIKPREGEPEPTETEHKCPNCGKPMIQRWSRRGPFLGCSGYPECKTTMNLNAEGQIVVTARPTEHKCEKCGSPMVIREGRRGPFLACTGYPKCRNALDVDAEGNPIRPVPTGIKCEKCNSEMVVKKGPRGPYLACSGYPKCRSYKPLPAELKERPDVQALMAAQAAKKAAAPQVEVHETCPECGSAMKLRSGRGGSYFLGCSKYPKCKRTRELSEELLEKVSQTVGIA